MKKQVIGALAGALALLLAMGAFLGGTLRTLEEGTQSGGLWVTEDRCLRRPADGVARPLTFDPASGSRCEVEQGVAFVENISLTAVSGEDIGLWVDNRLPIRIRNVTLVGYRAGIHIGGFLADLPSGEECDCAVEIERVRLQGAGRSPSGQNATSLGISIVRSGPGEIRIQDAQVGGFAEGIRIQGVLIAGEEPGTLDMQGLPPVTLQDVAISCDVTGVRTEEGTRILFRQVVVEGCHERAVWLFDGGKVKAEKLTLRKNALGLHMMADSYPADTLDISDSEFSGNGMAIVAQLSVVHVNRSIVKENGRPDGPAPLPDYPRGGIGLVLAGGGARGTRFEGNHDYAVGAGSWTLAFDARENWWGSSYGPTIASHVGPLGPGGDAVTANTVVFVPFLTQPP